MRRNRRSGIPRTRRRCRAAQTLRFFLRWRTVPRGARAVVAEFAVLGLDQFTKIVEQFSIAPADDLYEVRQRERPGSACIQQLPEAFARRITVQLRTSPSLR